MRIKVAGLFLYIAALRYPVDYPCNGGADCKAVVISQCETTENCFCIAKRQSYIEPETAVFLLTLPQLCQNHMTLCGRIEKWSESAAE